MTGTFLGFSPDTFRRRRNRVRQDLRGGGLILSSAPVLHRSRDTEYRYRPDSELFYLTGCVDPGVVAVLRGSEEDRFVVFVPDRDEERERWSGPRMGPEEAREILGADASFSMEKLEEHLPRLLRGTNRILFRLGVHSRLDSLVVKAMEWARTRGAWKGEGPRSLEDPGEVLDKLRLVKDPQELSRLRKAAEITVEAFREAMGGTRAGMGEWEVEALFESALRRKGASGPAFPTIVGSGKNGCVLHYSENADWVQEGQLVLLDGGAEVDLYAADVTRTYPVGGRFSQRQAAVYDVVLRAHGAAVSAIRPGVTPARVQEVAVESVTLGLMELGVLKGDVGGLLEQKAFEPFFPHKTSHWLGLDVHDVGGYWSEGTPIVFEPGMVLTVEPGLYFAPGLDSSSHPFSGIGVRIEDDIVVTDSGAENLTDPLPVDPNGVEALVGGAFKE